jgi:alkanesulfonate monooxygenase SsuD/methylene tetrahydromethanopterin reductase-like flavin-dependent oxidoreductase (luciferase family)
MATRFAITIPQAVPDGAFDPAAFRAYLERAEALGFESAWTAEQVLGTMPFLGPIETLTYAAACTRRLRLGCAALIAPLYSTVHLAKSLSTLDQLSRGRLEVALATGGAFRMFSAFDADRDSFVARFTEGVALMRALWTQPRVDFQGRFWQLEGGAMEPKPFQKPSPPVWIGGGHPDAVRRAVRIGDGFFGAGSTTTARFTDQVKVVRAALEEAGRDPGSFPIAKRVYLGIDDDAERAGRRVAAALDERYAYAGVRGLEPVAVCGPPDALVKGLREVVDAGAQLILLDPLFDEAEQMERLAAEVVPRL